MMCPETRYQQLHPKNGAFHIAFCESKSRFRACVPQQLPSYCAVQGSDPSPSFSSWAVHENQLFSAHGSASGSPGSRGGCLSGGTTPVLQPVTHSPRTPAATPTVHAASPAQQTQHSQQGSSPSSEVQPEGGEEAAWLTKVGTAGRLSPLVAVQMDRVKAVFLDRLGVKSGEEGLSCCKAGSLSTAAVLFQHPLCALPGSISWGLGAGCQGVALSPCQGSLD
jgi:hypothetical protein